VESDENQTKGKEKKQGLIEWDLKKKRIGLYIKKEMKESEKLKINNLK